MNGLSLPEGGTSGNTGQPGPGGVRFVLDGTVCVVVDHCRSIARSARLGTLRLGERQYVIVAAPDEVQDAVPDIAALLSPRELEIAVHIAAGAECKQVARKLRISVHTVRVHLARIYCKLGLHKQTQLAAIVAARFGHSAPPPFVRGSDGPLAPLRRTGRPANRFTSGSAAGPVAGPGSREVSGPHGSRGSF